VISTITAGKKAHGVVVSNDSQKVYLTNSGDNIAFVLDVTTQKVIRTISVGKALMA